MSSPKISVIIPVYNAERYLEQCLDSVINQTFKDIEIICINDGSTDGSLKILQKYAANDNKLIIIDKENRGVSAARNDGLERATGEYIMFLDADDFLEKNAFTKLLPVISEQAPDIACSGVNFYYSGKKEEMRWHSEKIWALADGKNYDENISYAQIYVWDKIFKHQFLKDNNIKFVENLVTAEDGLFAKICFFKNPKVSFLKEYLYNYRKDNKNSATCVIARPILTDLETFKILVNLNEFLYMQDRKKAAMVDFFLGGPIGYFNTVKNTKLKRIYLNDLMQFKDYINLHFSSDIIKCLNNFNNYQELCSLIQESKASFVSNIFSIKKYKNHIITKILGIKIKIRRANV